MANIPFKRRYSIHEAIGATSINESYMISDPESGCGLAAVDEKVGLGKSVAKAFVDKVLLPVHMVMTSSEGTNILEMTQPVGILKPVFTVKNSEGRILCELKSNICSLKPNIEVLDERGQVVGRITGNLSRRDFDLVDMAGKPVAKIKHLIESVVRELFTTADDYDVEMLIDIPDTTWASIALAATIAIDVWFHE